MSQLLFDSVRFRTKWNFLRGYVKYILRRFHGFPAVRLWFLVTGTVTFRFSSFNVCTDYRNSVNC